MKSKFTFFPYSFLYLIVSYISAIFFFTLFRGILLLSELKQIQNIHYYKYDLLKMGFSKGWQFDTSITCYILAPIFVILVIVEFLHYKKQWIYSFIKSYTLILFTLVFFICSVDIPFFNYNFSRLNRVIFSWMGDFETVIKMITQEKGFYVYFFVFLGIALLYYLIHKYLVKKYLLQNYFVSKINLSFFSFVMMVLIFLGMRGRIDSPIRISTAFTTEYPFINQLGLNPVFTLVRSYLDDLNLMEDKTAIASTRNYLGISSPGKFSSPVAREQTSNKTQRKMNVILVLMESMSAAKMKHFRQGEMPPWLTPNLDSISSLSICFDNIYSADKHTWNGIFSTLYGFPSLIKKHPMSNLHINKYSGIPGILKSKGYHNIFFTTHSPTFDNLQVFLTENYFDEIISQNHYPSDKIVGAFGVPDQVMFEFASQKINQLKKPFFATLLTTSDHPPYHLPIGIAFKPKNRELPDQMTEYADWCIGNFLKQCSQQSWYDSTIFIFIADHGCKIGKNIYDMPLSYHHIPLLFFSPALLTQPICLTQMGGQIDVFPTLMGILGISYINNTLGIDLLNEKRPYIYFSGDQNIACIDQEYFYIYGGRGLDFLYKYRKDDPVNYIISDKQRAEEMRNYAFSMIQCASWVVENDRTGKE